MDRLQKVLAGIDACNAEDPNREGSEGAELAYSRRLTEWVNKLAPQASEALMIAARGQHIMRWTLARADYDEGRVGYLKWREDLKKFHASKVTELMEQAGYESDTVEAVKDIILKKALKTNLDSQVMENALCLVFLETQYEELRQKTTEDKMKDILRKTWGKMSSEGHEIALKMNFSAEGKQLIEAALREEV